MEKLGTYYGIKKGGIINGYGRSTGRMSEWNVSSYSKLFETMGSWDKLKFNWYEDQMREKFGGTPTKIEVFKEKVDREDLEKELMNAKKRTALDKLNEKEAEALRNQMDSEPPKEPNRSAITGGYDDLSFRGLVPTNSEGKIIKKDGEVGSWKYNTFENLFRSHGSRGFRASTLSKVLSIATKNEGDVMRILVRMQDADYQKLRELAKEANAEKGKSKLDPQEKEALGIS